MICVQGIDCRYSLEPALKFMFWNKNEKKNPCTPQLYDIKVGFKSNSLGSMLPNL